MTTGEQHSHDTPGATDGGALDWFRILDILVWGAVAVVAILAIEWFAGVVVRERISAGATKYLKLRANAAPIE